MPMAPPPDTNTRFSTGGSRRANGGWTVTGASPSPEGDSWFDLLKNAGVKVIPIAPRPDHFAQHFHQDLTWWSTPGIRDLDPPEETIAGLVTRFAKGDWGDVYPEDAASNNHARRTGQGGMLGCYTITAKGEPAENPGRSRYGSFKGEPMRPP